MAAGSLPKSPVSSSLCHEVPHIFIPKSHLEAREFLISSAKRLLQHNRHLADIDQPLVISRALSGHALNHPAKKSTTPVSRLYIAPAILIAPFDSISASTGLSLRISAIVISVSYT